MNRDIKIMLAEDHTLFRQALSALLGTYGGIKVIGAASNGIEILKLIRANKPDVLISDIRMPIMNGFELAEIIRKEFPTVKIIFLSMHYSSVFASDMITNGINSCLPKECDSDILVEAIHKVHKQGFYFNPKLNNIIVSQILTDRQFEGIRKQLALSHREAQILELICDGKINREIAEKLQISTATIDFHRQNIYKKTDISSVALLVKYAIKNGITTVD